VECHGEQKQKAKLALHTWEGLMRGSDAGPVLIAGKPNDSILLQRMRLPLTDEEHMPPQEHPQPAAEELALLARWIERGAGKATTLAALQLPDSLSKAAAEIPARLAAMSRGRAESEPLWEHDPAEVARSRAPLAREVAELQRRFPGALSYESRTSAALHFTAAGFGRAFGDNELALLVPLREQLVALEISHTAVSEDAASLLAGFIRLKLFRAGFTEVGDRVVEALVALPSLEVVGLPGTRVTASSIPLFRKASRLRTLSVGGTTAEDAARAAGLPVPSGSLLEDATVSTPELPVP
jgi:hypothetical protein